MNIRKLKQFVINKLTEELSDKLSYHGVHHTLDVLRVCNEYIKRMSISREDAFLLRTAALLHDIGFIQTYNEHEEESVKYAKKILPEWNYTDEQIEIIAGMIRATKIPQLPKTTLEKIIGDADLDYLGTDSFYAIGDTLFKELMAFNKISNEEDWDKIQIRFLQNHTYHTAFAQKNREPLKQKHLAALKQKWNIN
ncbi:HD domain-containing protein [Maribellus sediminis]|uniref:HD domain-containing protein n=1 Tax=Maribellus sediminis TaxID=2696285 RepID=UPI00143059A3|nr:HD domain-containing protein [Maribellus sediminis]